MIPFSWSCSSKIMFKSQFGPRATLWNLIVTPLDKGINIMSTSSVQMTWPTAMTKSIFLTRMLLKSWRLLHRCQDVYESRYKEVLFTFCSCCSLTMNTVSMDLDSKGLWSELSWFFVIWWALFSRELFWLSNCNCVFELLFRLLVGWKLLCKLLLNLLLRRF